MSKELLKNIIEDFNPDKFSDFFRDKNRKFERTKENLSEYNDDKFVDCTKLGEINFDSDNTFFVLIKSKNELSEKSSKKLQYEKAKKILKDKQADSGIFIFYDVDNNFRFSLVYADYVGRREWSSFKRFTYFVKQGLTNKTFLDRIGGIEFESLAKIKEAFSVEKVTKEFYKDIANWYFWAVDNSRFPDSAEEIENGRNIAVIRLITRLIFIWFMKELKLIPENLFKKSFAKVILKDLNNDESSYYKAILQNLFFATLSTPKEQREFAEDKKYHKGYNEDFGNQSVFRYHELFKNPDVLKSYFDDIPFLNGGLFECLDKGDENYYIDGFTRRNKYQPSIPNSLFFSSEKEMDLNKWYGTKNKKYKVKGLLEILSSYNFTVDENTPDDSDVALDPELLGKVFENLLASFNPETSTTARKATGSFYTPREIVDYMVTESLKEYFKTHLGESDDVESNLEKLFNPLEQDNPFTDNSKDTRNLVKLIENVKIVDPAVGSGAFPMGILNKLVFVLNKIDKGNKLWKEAQLTSVENIQDSRLREETISHIENYFKNKNPDYGRKLYLIQRCIYGVDIQQIAVEIAKLRFFISLLIDERIDKSKPNWNIEPLPNLDFKIMQGNSLLEEYEGIKLFDESLFDNIDESKLNQMNILKHKQKSIQDEVLELNRKGKYTADLKREYSKKLEEVSKKIEALRLGKKTSDNIFDIFDTHLETNQKRDDLTKLHREYFEVSEKSAKDKIKKKIEKLEWELIEATLISQGKRNKLDELDKIRKSNTKPFFLWKLHFPEVFVNKGFDVVIGNPPYIDSESMIRDNPEYRNLLKSVFSCAKGNWDLFVVFVEKAFHLLSSKGCFSFIIPNKIISAKYTYYLRDFLLSKTIIELIDYSSVDVFKEADVYPIILIANNLNNRKEVVKTKVMSDLISVKTQNIVSNDIFYKDIYWDKYFFDDKVLDIIINITSNNKLVDYFPNILGSATVSEAYEIKDYINELNCDTNYFKLINTGTIDPFISLWGIKETQYLKNKYSKPIINKSDLRSISENRYNQSLLPKIIIAGMSLKIEAYLDSGFYCAGKSTIIVQGNLSELKSLICILNSKLVSYWFAKYFNSLSMAGGYFNIGVNEIGLIPVPNNLSFPLSQLTILADYISFCKSNDVDPYYIEKIIDAVVYELYFEHLTRVNDCKILNHLSNLSEMSNIENNSQNIDIINNFLIKYSDPSNPIYKSINRMYNIEEIKIIENNT